MTIYDALSQEYGLSIYHDYLLDNNCEQLAEMCLNQFIELIHTLIWSCAMSQSESRSKAWAWSHTVAQTEFGFRSTSHAESRAGKRTRSQSGTRTTSKVRSWTGATVIGARSQSSTGSQNT